LQPLGVDFLPFRADALAQGRGPGALLRPLRRDHRLTVEVHIKENGLGVCNLAWVLGEDQRPSIVRQLLRSEAALLERDFEPIGIPLDVDRDDCIVRQG
jgi:hypothetical protein